MSVFDALTRRIDNILLGVEHMRFVERLRSTLWRLPERWVRIDDSGHEEVVYETPANETAYAQLRGVGPVIHTKEYIVTDDWNPDMEGIDP